MLNKLLNKRMTPEELDDALLDLVIGTYYTVPGAVSGKLIHPDNGSLFSAVAKHLDDGVFPGQIEGEGRNHWEMLRYGREKGRIVDIDEHTVQVR